MDANINIIDTGGFIQMVFKVFHIFNQNVLLTHEVFLNVSIFIEYMNHDDLSILTTHIPLCLISLRLVRSGLILRLRLWLRNVWRLLLVLLLLGIQQPIDGLVGGLRLSNLLMVRLIGLLGQRLGYERLLLLDCLILTISGGSPLANHLYCGAVVACDLSIYVGIACTILKD